MAGGGLIYFSFLKETPEAKKAREYREIAERVNKNLKSTWWVATLPEAGDPWWTAGASSVDLDVKVSGVIPKEAKKDATTFMGYCYEKVKEYKSYPQGDALLSQCLKPTPVEGDSVSQ